MKQRILLIVAMLLIAAPAFAVVNITATPGPGTSGNNKLTVTYKCDNGEAVRAFALDFNLGPTSPGQVLWSEVNDFNRGESNKPGGGYGIFPGQFRNQIDPANPNWFATYYYPVAPSGDVDSNGTGIGARKVICELGTLYKDANAPGSSGKLFTLLADPNGQQQVGLTVTTNTVRGKVVLENGTSVDPNITFPNPWQFVTCPSAPATLTYPAADANNGRYQVSWSAVADATSYKLQRSADGGTNWVNVGTGAAPTGVYAAPPVCDDVNTGSYRYQVCSQKAGCADSAWKTGTTDCAVVLCFPTTYDSNMTNWKALGKPRCWCYLRQCKGDTTGTVEGNSKTGYYWVGNPDLQTLLKAYQIREPTFNVGIKGEPNICASFKHYREGNSKTGYYWVGNPDLQILLKAYQIREPTFGSGIGTCPAGASGSRFTLPTDNKPCN